MNNLNKRYDPKVLNIIFLALAAGQIILLIFIMVTLKSSNLAYVFNNLAFTFIPLAALLLDIVGNRLFASGFTKLSSEADLGTSLQKLMSIHIVRWALTEAGTLLLIVFALRTENHFFTAFAVANLAYFITLRPKVFTFNEGF